MAADKKGGKAASADDIMSAADMRPILALARHGETPSFALTLTKEKEAVLLLDKRKKPKKLVSEMKKSAEKAHLEIETTLMRFGRCKVTPSDATMLVFLVNKDAPGALRPKVLETVKKAGFAKVDFQVDASLDAESEEDEPAAAAGAAPAAPGAAAPAPPAAPQPAAPQQPAAAPPPPPPPPQGPAPQPASAQGGQNAAQMTSALAAAVKNAMPRVAGDPNAAAILKTVAREGQAALQAGDFGTVAGKIQELQSLAAGAAGGAAQPAGPAPAAPSAPAAAAGPSATVHAKSRLAWIATRKKVEADLDKLKKGILAACNGIDIEAPLEGAFRDKVEPLLGTLDESLAEKLDEVNEAKDPSERAKLITEAQKIVGDYRKYVAGEPIIAKLDANPFVPLSIGQTINATLSTLAGALR